MRRAALDRRFPDIRGTTGVLEVHLRTHRAALLPVETDLPVAGMAAAIGYSRRRHFSRAFRKVMTADPVRFRHGRARGGPTGHLRDVFPWPIGPGHGRVAHV